jgi:hypothetical protein
MRINNSSRLTLDPTVNEIVKSVEELLRDSLFARALVSVLVRQAPSSDGKRTK